MKMNFEQIKAAFDQETAQRKLVRKRDEIPMAFEDITTDWLDDVLGAKANGSTVTGFTLGPEDEGTSSRRRIEIQYSSEQHTLPSSVFCNCLLYTSPSPRDS